MGRRSRRATESEDLNVWPSFTDLMANAFMIISLFLLLVLFKSLFLKSTAQETELNLSQSESQVRTLEQQLAVLEDRLQQRTGRANRLQRQTRDLQSLLQQSRAREARLETEVERLKSAPPVVVIQDSGEYQFDSGSAELPEELRNYVETELVDRIEQITRERNLYVVEIIGHTDGQIIASNSNLDRSLEAVASGRQSVEELNPGSNADLGLMRALEVVKQLQEVQKSGRLQGLEFRAYSAAQLLLPSGDFASANREPDSARRRIEIRFSPLGRAETVR